MNCKRWVIGFLGCVVFLMLLGALPTIIVDPYFHFHKPLPQLNYVMDNQRYQNDGILKHFSYDAVVTGTSMTENFKTTEVDSLFGTNSVKTPYFGASYKEVCDSLEKAFQANPDIRYVIRGIDCNQICNPKDNMSYDDGMFPTYLYDRKVYNDVYYVLNKQVLFSDTSRILAYTNSGIEGTTFDEYSNWHDHYEYGKDVILQEHGWGETAKTSRSVTDTDLTMLRENFEQNFIRQAKEHPDVQFYYFFSPYSIMWWDGNRQSGEIEWYTTLMEEASRIMTEYDNIHLFSFFEVTDVICELDYYRDVAHYSGDVNSMMLHWMKDGKYRLTKNNYEKHWENVQSYYENYDYRSLFVQ